MAGNCLVSICCILTRKTAYQAHSFSYYEHQRLVCDSSRGSNEEVCQSDMEEGEGCDDRSCGYETHFEFEAFGGDLRKC